MVPLGKKIPFSGKTAFFDVPVFAGALHFTYCSNPNKSDDGLMETGRDVNCFQIVWIKNALRNLQEPYQRNSYWHVG